MAAKLETIKTQAVRRSLEITRDAANPEARTVPLSFSSDSALYEPSLDALVILDHSPGCCDLSRMQGGPVLVQHNRNDQVGAAENCEIKDGKGYAIARFSKSTRGEEIWTDVKDGIRRQVSVDAILNHLVQDKPQNGMKVLRAVKWTPVEISIVSIAQDTSVGIARADNSAPTYETQFETPESMSQTITAPAAPATPDLKVVREEATTAANVRSKAIFAAADVVAKLHPKAGQKVNEIARANLATDKPVDAIQREMLEAIPGVEEAGRTTPTIGMNGQEVQRFSLLKACRDMFTTGRLEGLEKEACEATRKNLKRELKNATAFVVPEEVSTYGRQRLALAQLQRAQTAGIFADGGALVQEQYGPMIELLRNQTALGRAGITILSGLVGNLVLPTQLTGATAYWVTETGTITDAAATFGQKAMVPHRLGATIPFSNQFLSQTGISAEDFLRNELMTAMNLKKDLAGLHGSGAAGEPLGVQNTTGINATVTYSGAAAWTHVVEHETGIAADNADIGSMAFILSAATVGKWKTKLKDSVAGAGYLIEGGGQNMTANGYPVLRTNQISGNISFFGVWSQLILGSWAGLEVIVNPYTLDTAGQVRITMQELVDFLARQPLAFNVSTDTAAA